MEYDMDATSGRYPESRDYISPDEGYDDDSATAERLPAIDYDLLPSDFSDDAVEATDGTTQYAGTSPLGSANESNPADNTISKEDTSTTSDVPTSPNHPPTTGTVKRYGPRTTTDKLATVRATSEIELRGVQGTLQQLSIADLRNVVGIYKQDIEYVRQALENPDIYQFKLYTAPPENTEIRVPNVCGLYYGWQREKTRTDALGKILDSALSFMQTRDPNFNDTGSAARQVLDGTYTQIANIKTVHNSPASLPYTNQLGGPKKMAVVAGLRELNQLPKPPELAAWMQQSTPRFTWEGQSLPDADVPEDYRPRLQELWTGYTLKDADYLTLPQKLADGKAPYHKAMLAADAIAADGHVDAAYSIKAAVIKQVLDMENAGSIPDNDNKVEMPLFNIVLAGALTGQIANPPKGASYNYAAGIRDIFDETWRRVPQETGSGQPNAATSLLERIAVTPAGNISEYIAPYLAQSLVDSARRGSVDVVAALRSLRKADKSWAPLLIENVAAMPNRPILTNAEAGTFAVASLPEVVTVAPERISEAVGRFSHEGETDLYSFKMPLSDIADTPRNVTATVHVDIEPTNGSVLATINYKNNGTTRQVPLTIELASDEVSLATIDDEPLDPETAERYKSIIENAIVTHDERLQAVEAEAAAAAARRLGGTALALDIVHTSTPSPQQERTEPKLKTRGVAAEGVDTPTSPSEAVVQPTGGVRVTGITLETITSLLGDQSIKDIPASQIALKLDFLLRKARETNTSFGRQAPLVSIRGADKVTLRELKWVAGGGHRQIRIYFEDAGNGQLALCGIYDKKGTNSHLNNLKKLVAKLNAKKSQ
jgi:hypothetical protein